MNRRKDLEKFYKILSKLQRKVAMRYLPACKGSMGWPPRGIYFFFDNDEPRGNNSQPRVVRVGTHAVTNESGTSIWERLRAHRGNLSGKYVGGGNHRGSIFRHHIGTALINRDKIRCPSWGKGSSASVKIRKLEHSLEIKVSKYIATLPFLCLSADDKPSARSIRKVLEKNSIALLSNFNKAIVIDPPSEKWLGHYASNEFMSNSGLWNVDHVDEDYNSDFLDILNLLVEDMEI